MQISLNPGEQFVIVRQLPDHTDATTYYVRAVIRNSVTGVIIDTLNLIDAGSSSRRFTKSWQVTADVSGIGTYIDITTSVYTSAAYTTKAGAYGDDNDTYLIFDRSKAALGGGTGGYGADIDYKKIKKMLDAVAKSIINGLPVPTDLQPVQEALQSLTLHVQSQEDITPEPVDLSPVLAKINNLKTALVKGTLAVFDKVSAIKIPTPEPPEKIDLTPITKAIQSLSIREETHLADVMDTLDTIEAYVTPKAVIHIPVKLPPAVTIDEALKGAKRTA